MADLYLMVGCPGSGKTTFLKNFIKNEKSVVISRDTIRFSLLQEDDEYFSKELEVKKIFWQRINDALKAGYDVFADQTSLTPKSRFSFLRHIYGYVHVNAIWIDEPLEVCLERNKTRLGTDAYVPEDNVYQMHNALVPPSLQEGFYRIFRYNSQEDQITYIGAPM